MLKDIAALTPSFLDRPEQSHQARKVQIERQALATAMTGRDGSEKAAVGSDAELSPSLKDRLDVLIRAIGVANSWDGGGVAGIESRETAPWIST